jgi:hypothetical protein
MTLAVDISNYTGPITLDQVNAWREAGVGLVLVQAVDPPAGYPPGVTRQQLEVLRDAVMPADAYVFFWFEADAGHVDRALTLLDGFPVRRVWLDLEDTAAQRFDQATTEAKVADALQRCDAWSQGRGLPTAGIYTGHWYWADPLYTGNTQAFADRLLWDSHYDFIADASQGFRAYGGWTECVIKQHIGSSTFCNVAGLDQNCLSASYAEALGAPPVLAQERGEEVSCPPVPADYQEKFGLGAEGWPGVAVNLEGIIRQVMGELEQVTLVEQADEAKLARIREIVARYRSGKLGAIRKLVEA